MALIKKEDFYNTFFQKDKISPLYTSISYKYNNEIFFSPNKTDAISNTNVTLIKQFPRYLKSQILNENNFKTKKIIQNNLLGFGILINGINDIDTFLKNSFKSQTRTPILKRIKRLESCFNIQYKMFFGEISKDHYNEIMISLKEMLSRRFTQKNDSNEFFDKWNHYYGTTYDSIISKEASLFAVYANEEIIGISINYHVKDIFIGHIIAYNIDFSKFSIGNTIVCKLLDWCIKNKYSIVDMGNGALDYKRMWCNFSYNYEYQIIYKKNSISAILVANFELIKILLKNKLKAFKVDLLIEKIKRQSSTKNRSSNKPTLYRIEAITTGEIMNPNLQLQKIKFNDLEYLHIKKPICDFLYDTQGFIDEIEIYKKNENNFIVRGKTNVAKIVFIGI